VIPPPLGGTNDVCEAWSYNPEKAKEIWDASGGLDEITFWFNAGAGHEDWIEAVVNQWGENLGMDTSTVTFEPREWADYLPLLTAGEVTGPYRIGWGQDYPSALNFLEPLYASSATPDKGGSNYTFYQNPEFDALLEEGKAAVAASGILADAMPFYQEAERVLCEDAQVLGIQFGLNQFVWNDDVSEVYMDSFGDVGYTVVQSQDGAVTQNLDEPQSLISTNANESEGVAVLRALNTGLLQFEPINNTQFDAHAESITTEDGGKTWTIVLNPGWTFHDGTPVTAESYAKAWSYGADAANAQLNNSHFNNIVGYDELNPEEG
jgi:ABC-type transport system substrate-binding protein